MRKAVVRVMEETRVDGRRMTSAELARRTALPDSSVRRRIDGAVLMDPDYFEAICEALEVPIQDVWDEALRIRDTEPQTAARRLKLSEQAATKRGRKRHGVAE